MSTHQPPKLLKLQHVISRFHDPETEMQPQPCARSSFPMPSGPSFQPAHKPDRLCAPQEGGGGGMCRGGGDLAGCSPPDLSPPCSRLIITTASSSSSRTNPTIALLIKLGSSICRIRLVDVLLKCLVFLLHFFVHHVRREKFIVLATAASLPGAHRSADSDSVWSSTCGLASCCLCCMSASLSEYKQLFAFPALGNSEARFVRREPKGDPRAGNTNGSPCAKRAPRSALNGLVGVLGLVRGSLDIMPAQ